MTPAVSAPRSECICAGGCEQVVATCLDHAKAKPLQYAQVAFQREHPTCAVIVHHRPQVRS